MLLYLKILYLIENNKIRNTGFNRAQSSQHVNVDYKRRNTSDNSKSFTFSCGI